MFPRQRLVSLGSIVVLFCTVLIQLLNRHKYCFDVNIPFESISYPIISHKDCLNYFTVFLRYPLHYAMSILFVASSIDLPYRLNVACVAQCSPFFK